MRNATLNVEVHMLIQTSAGFAITVKIQVIMVTILRIFVVGVAFRVARADTHTVDVGLGIDDCFQRATMCDVQLIRQNLDYELQPLRPLDDFPILREVVSSIL